MSRSTASLGDGSSLHLSRDVNEKPGQEQIEISNIFIRRPAEGYKMWLAGFYLEDTPDTSGR